MPTIAIAASPPLPSARQRAVVLRLTRWLVDRGVRPERVVVRFDPAPDLYAGGWPVSGHTTVTCCVGPDRDGDFRAALAGHVAATLGGTGFFYLEFRTTPPADVYVRVGHQLVRADQPDPVREETA
ncbi:hypothetical protein AB0H63_17245 [Micromonospora echinospora]|uniref:hypothetical protein n=1 Tax=Micromonospora echinospora TaxID=1877 RepID=UPI0033DF61F1